MSPLCLGVAVRVGGGVDVVLLYMKWLIGKGPSVELELFSEQEAVVDHDCCCGFARLDEEGQLSGEVCRTSL